jgi:hypothetical protein
MLPLVDLIARACSGECRDSGMKSLRIGMRALKRGIARTAASLRAPRQSALRWTHRDFAWPACASSTSVCRRGMRGSSSVFVARIFGCSRETRGFLPKRAMLRMIPGTSRRSFHGPSKRFQIARWILGRSRWKSAFCRDPGTVLAGYTGYVASPFKKPARNSLDLARDFKLLAEFFKNPDENRAFPVIRHQCSLDLPNVS